MDAIARGDASALAALYDRHHAILFALCARVLNDQGEAEQVLLDLFLSLWQHPDRYDPTRGSLIVYLITIARSRSIDRRRSIGRHHSPGARNDAAQPAALPMSHATPLDGIVADERRARIHAALSELSDGQRDAIELSVFEGLSHGEIAQRLSKPLGTVKTNIRSGLIRLRDCLRTEKGDVQ